MYNELINRMEYTLDYMRDTKTNYEVRLNGISQYLNKNLKSWKSKSGVMYYSTHETKDCKSKYLGKALNDDVNRIKEARFLDKSIKVLEKDIKVLEYSLEKILPFDYDSINSILPKNYRNPILNIGAPREKEALEWKEQGLAYKARFPTYRPEDLKVETKDGSMVRSKSEALIYNTLLDRGVAFVYEMPLKINGKTFIPDFTLLSEADYKSEILIEHQGLIDNEHYRKRFAEKVHAYWCGGYIQGINIFYTFDSPNGGLDTTPISDIIKTRIKKTF